MRIKVNNDLKVDILSVYAPTLNKSRKSLNQRKKFIPNLIALSETSTTDTP